MRPTLDDDDDNGKKRRKKNFCDPSQFAGVKSGLPSCSEAFHMSSLFTFEQTFLSNKLQINELSSKIFTAIYFGLNQKKNVFHQLFLLASSFAFSFDVLSHLAISFSFVFPLLRVAS